MGTRCLRPSAAQAIVIPPARSQLSLPASLAGKAEDGIKDMLEALQIRKALPAPAHRDLADVNALLSNAWLTIAGNATDDTAAPKVSLRVWPVPRRGSATTSAANAPTVTSTAGRTPYPLG